MPIKLYDKTVKNAAPRDRRYEIADSLQPGLRLVVQPSGAKSWAYRYEREDRKGVKVTLGRAAGPGALTLQQARDAANDARRLRSTGGEPGVERGDFEVADSEKSDVRRRDSASDVGRERGCGDAQVLGRAVLGKFGHEARSFRTRPRTAGGNCRPVLDSPACFRGG